MTRFVAAAKSCRRGYEGGGVMIAVKIGMDFPSPDSPALSPLSRPMIYFLV